MRIAFVGKAGAGKTTLARFMASEFGYTRLSFAKKVKEFTGAILLRPINKTRDRAALQAMGDGMRQSDSTIWIRWFEWELRAVEEQDVENIVVDDCRYLNEASFLKKEGFVLVRVAGRQEPLAAEQADHISETEQEKIKCDFEIDNGGTLNKTLQQLGKVLADKKKMGMYTKRVS